MNFKNHKISNQVMVTCADCLRGDCFTCKGKTPIKKVKCLCSFMGHENRGTGGKVE